MVSLKSVLICGYIFLIATLAQAQSTVTMLPRGSQFQSIIQRIGISDVTIDYHRPAVKQREVWGKMVPYNSGTPFPWRAGANENTTITFSHDVKVEGQSLPAGTYGLHMIPGPDSWIVMFSYNNSSWGSFSYNPGEDALRVSTTPIDIKEHHEFLNYQFYDLTHRSAVIGLNWEKKRIPISIEFDVHQIVLSNLRNELRNKPGWTWIGWNEAANYCLSNQIEFEQGLQWAGRSVWMKPNFSNIHTQSKLRAAINNPENMESATLEYLAQTMENQHVGWIGWDQAANYMLTNNGDLKVGTQWADRSISIQKNIKNMMTKIALLEKQGLEKEARELTEKAIASSSSGEINTYAYKLMFSGGIKKAIELFEANTRKYPRDANAWDSLGEAYFRSNQKDMAITSFQKALSLKPNSAVKQNSEKYLKLLGVDINN